MSLIEHLAELRTRIIYGFGFLLLGFIVAWFFRDYLFAFLQMPLELAAPDEKFAQIHHKDVTEPFFVMLTISAVAGAFVGAPGILYQIWKFVAPGLYDSEKRLALPFTLAATFFFFTGAGFCYFVVLPYGYEFLLTFVPAEVSEPELMMAEYISVTAKLMLGFGIVFELPVFSAFLAKIGVITHRTLVDYWRYAFCGAFLMAAMLTPPDVFTQLMMAGPLVVLYLLAIAGAWFFGAER